MSTDTKTKANKTVVTTADNVILSLRSGSPISAVATTLRSAENMQRIDSPEIFEKAKAYERWILFYDYSWAPSGANKGAFLFWVHRKQIYLKKESTGIP